MKKCGNTPGSPLAKVRFPYFGLIISTILAFTLTLDGDVAFAQAYTASLTGVVTDSSGAAIPNVSIMLRNMSTEEARTTTSGPDGWECPWAGSVSMPFRRAPGRGSGS